MKAIMAMSENRVIGKNGGLPWPIIKDDFKYFKEFTSNKILVCGHRTFNTLPPLRNRNIIVVSSISNWDEDSYDPIFNSAVCYESFQDILVIKESQPNLICIGGAKTYALFLPYITEFHVTHINGKYEGDTFMIPFEHLFDNQEVVKEFEGGHKVIKYFKN